MTSRSLVPQGRGAGIRSASRARWRRVRRPAAWPDRPDLRAWDPGRSSARGPGATGTRAHLPDPVAQRDHDVEAPPDELVDVLRAVRADVDPTLPHDADRVGMQRLRATAGRRGDDPPVRHRLEQRFGDLRTGAVPRAQEQDALAGAASPACRWVPAVAQRRARARDAARRPQPGAAPGTRRDRRCSSCPGRRPSCDASAPARRCAAGPGGTTPGSAARPGGRSAPGRRGRCARARGGGATARDSRGVARIPVARQGRGARRRSAARTRP